MAGDRASGGGECSTAGSDDAPAAELTLDAVFELLANRRRRLTLYCLHESATPVIDFDPLVESVTAHEARLDQSLAGSSHERCVACDLDTWHLEVLEELGVAEYDARSGSIRFHGDPALERWLDRVRPEELDGDNPA